MSTRVPVGPLADFPPGTVHGFEHDDEAYVLVHDEEGNLSVFEDRCSHQDLPLAEGSVEGCRLICPWHGASFHAGSGEALTMPAVAPIEKLTTEVVDGVVTFIPED